MTKLKKGINDEPSPEQVIWVIALHGALSGGTTVLGAAVAADNALVEYRARLEPEAA